jgi:hypothetical protein
MHPSWPLFFLFDAGGNMLRPWQTRAADYHPYLVNTVDALPESLRELVKAALPPGTNLVRALVVPTDYRAKGLMGARLVPEQALIFTTRGVLYVQKGAKGEPSPAPFFTSPDTLLYMRSSHQLLYGRLQLVSAIEGKTVAMDMEFNAVGWRLMDDEWRSLVGSAIGLTALAAPEERIESEQEQTLLSSLPSKFSFGLQKYGLYTGEKLFGAIFQPGIWDKSWSFFHRQITANTLLALTDASILILEEERALVRKSQQYGLTITRIPRQSIADVQTTPKDFLQELIISLTRSGAMTDRRYLLEPDTVQSWLKLWEKSGTKLQRGRTASRNGA